MWNAVLVVTVAVAGAWLCPSALSAQVEKPGARSVSITDDGSAYTLANGIITARVDKKSGDLLSMRFKGTEMLATIYGSNGLPDTTVDKPGANLRGGGHRYTDHQYGFWSHDTDGPHTLTKITIDPKSNNGERGEVSIKGISDGKPMGAGPGGSFISDVEIRYTLERGRPGLYTYSIFEHQKEYPASSLGEARFCVKLNDFFDWMTVGPKYNKLYPKAQPGEHEDKYDFTADQFENPAFGWSSTSKKIGFWFLNPSVEYLSGGPTKVEFLGHRDTNDVQAPTVLNYWRSSHYGGAVVEVAQGEHWTKVIGPFLLYVNDGKQPTDLYSEALAEARKETQRWPYSWVSGVDYPRPPERVAVSGRIVLKDSQAKDAKMTRVRVGLAAPAYMIQPVSRTGAAMPARQIDWQTDAKHYEFWAFADSSGRFRLGGVRPGNYTLHAIADGVLGEYAKADVTVTAGKPLDLGTIEWAADRRGKQIWEIGIPNRTGSEFAKGDDYAHDGMFLTYAKLFPSDITYTVGKSDYRKDWYFEQVPHNEDPNAKAAGYNMGTPQGRATPWTIAFQLPSAPAGKAHLRLAIAANSARQIEVVVNDQPVGQVDHMFTDGAIARNGITGVWSERDVVFDASALKAGANTLKLIVPAGPLTAGVIYDYLRLEIDDAGK
ncbi:MAG TPA: polysaccharide lyase family protein [Candidatus Limnocylindrales bacterium]|nr:polysaccharide lyase family protein [Candidatus Limnocylindrales bacterium]